MIAHAIRVMELTDTWRATVPGEPQMGRRGLYPTTSTRTSGRGVRDMMNVLAYLDGTNDTMDLAAITGLTVVEVAAIAQQLVEAGVAERVEGVAPPLGRGVHRALQEQPGPGPGARVRVRPCRRSTSA